MKVEPHLTMYESKLYQENNFFDDFRKEIVFDFHFASFSEMPFVRENGNSVLHNCSMAGLHEFLSQSIFVYSFQQGIQDRILGNIHL